MQSAHPHRSTRRSARRRSPGRFGTLDSPAAACVRRAVHFARSPLSAPLDVTPSLSSMDYEQLYRSLVDAAPDTILGIDEVGVVLALNPAGERLLGRSADEVIGRPLAGFIPERLRAEFARDVERYVRIDGRPLLWRSVPIPIVAGDGREVPAEISLGALSTGEPRVFSGIIRDLSGQAAAEELLIESTAMLKAQSVALEEQIGETRGLTADLVMSNDLLLHLRSDLEHATERSERGTRRVEDMLDAVSDAVSVFDAEWRWTYLNPAAAEMLRAIGRDAGASLGRVLWEELPELVGSRFEIEARRAVALGAIATCYEYFPMLERSLEIHIVPSPGAVATFTHDVRGRRRSVTALRLVQRASAREPRDT